MENDNTKLKYTLNYKFSLTDAKINFTFLIVILIFDICI
ncbi:MAG: hypothetical protein UW66_C0041G0001, partial [Candidatus Moranbacteria bacterium GW2011_GWF1_44_4]